MQANNYPVHHTITNKIPDSQGGGWEFWCVECSYRVRYTQHDTAASQQLQVLDSGDPWARHTSNQFSQEDELSPDEFLDQLGLGTQPGTAEFPPDELLPLDEEFDEDTWLNPEIRAFLAQLVGRLDP